MPRNRVTGPGSYNVICDRCGFKFKNHQLRKEWTGAMVCHGPSTNDCWEPRHPQDLIKAKQDNHPLPFIRPDDGDGIDVSPTLNCSGLDTEMMTNLNLNTRLQLQASTTLSPTPEYDIYNITTYGGTVDIPDGLIVHVKCTLTIGT